MYEVIYSSWSGNTKKVAMAIADELGVESRHVKSVDSLPIEAEIFLGSGLYLLRPSKLIREFIRNHDFQGEKVALFGTSTSGIRLEILAMERLLRKKGAIITGKFHCPGRFFLRVAGKTIFIRKNRPEGKNLDNAREFALSIKNRLSDTNIFNESQEDHDENRVLSRV